MDIPSQGQESTSPPSSPDFLGFGSETVLPRRLVLETSGDGENEYLVNVYRERKTGRPKGSMSGAWYLSGGGALSTGNITNEKRRISTQGKSLDISTLSNPSPATSSLIPSRSSATGAGTSIRQKLYMLDKIDPKLKFSKLPKASAVLKNFLSNLKESSDTHTASQSTISELKQVWVHHFDSKVILELD